MGDVGTVDSFYDANIMLTRPGAVFKFYDPRRPIYTHPRFLPGSRLSECSVRNVTLAEGCYLDRCTVEDSIVGIRTTIQPGAAIRRSVLLGADFYEGDDEIGTGDGPRLGIGRDVVLDRVIVDKNARIGEVRTGQRGPEEPTATAFHSRRRISTEERAEELGSRLGANPGTGARDQGHGLGSGGSRHPWPCPN